MLRLAPDPSTREPLVTDLYPEFKVVEWEKCIKCDKDVDAYVYVAGMQRGYCFEHYNGALIHAE